MLLFLGAWYMPMPMWTVPIAAVGAWKTGIVGVGNEGGEIGSAGCVSGRL